MPGRRIVLFCILALGARQAKAQVAVVGPSFAALSVPDLPASINWYRDIFGMSIIFQGAAPDSSTKVALLAGPGLRVELVWHESAKSLSSYTGGPIQPDMVFGSPKIGFFVRDMDSAIAVLRARHATIEGTWLVRPPNVSPSDTLWTRNILVRDNSGTYVQLFERRP